MKSYPFIRIIAAVVVPFLILSCSEKGDETPVTSSFNVESPIVNVGVSGGSFNLEYSIDGPQAGAVADVVTETSWLKIGAVSSSGIEVSVLANTDGVDRTGKIELKGKGIKDKTVHVLQSKLSDSEPFYSKFAFDISNVTTSTVDVEITPVDPAAYYYTTIVSKKDSILGFFSLRVITTLRLMKMLLWTWMTTLSIMSLPLIWISMSPVMS